MHLTTNFWSYMIRLILHSKRTSGSDNTAMTKRMLALATHIDSRQVDFDDFIEEMHALLEFNQDTDIIWKLQPVFQIGLLGAAFTSLFAAADMKMCLQDLRRLGSTYFGVSVKLVISANKDQIKCTFSRNDEDYRNEEAGVFDALVLFFFYLARFICGEKFDANKVLFPVSRRDINQAVVRNVTQADIDFWQDEYSIIFSKSWLTYDSLFYNPLLRSDLLSDIEREIALNQNSMSFTQQTMATIKKHPQPASVSLTHVCDELAVSESTARRKLKEEGSSFSRIQKWWLYQQAVSQILSTDKKVDVIALELGYSERAAFERSFKAQMGITAAKFREIARGVNSHDSERVFKTILSDLPPMPKSCQQLIKITEDILDVPTAVNIISADPLFSGRIIGLASRAIYGSAPKDLYDAVSHKLGVKTVKNLALVFGAKDLLSSNVLTLDIDKLVQAILISPRVYQLLVKQVETVSADKQNEDEQLLSFGLLGLFLLFHKDSVHREKIVALYHSSSCLLEFNELLHKELSMGVYSTASILLATWGVTDDAIRRLSSLQTFINTKQPKASNLALIEYTHALAYAAVGQQKDAQYALQDRADELNIQNLKKIQTDIEQLLA